jgi:hypothetical protein
MYEDLLNLGFQDQPEQDRETPSQRVILTKKINGSRIKNEIYLTPKQFLFSLILNCALYPNCIY